MNLHSANSTNTFKPLQREMRLRIWQVLRNLDFRAALDRGVDPIIRLDSYDTPHPSNLNDLDLTEDLIEQPIARSGITDVSYGAVPDEGIKVASALQYLDTADSDSTSDDIWSRRLAMVRATDDMIHARYLTYCDITNPLQWMMVYTAHALSTLCQFLAVRPMSRVQSRKQVQHNMSPREILDRAVQSLQAEELFFQTPMVKGFWWCIWNHWYVLAVALVEICASPALCKDEETWAVLQHAFDRQSRSIADTTNGKLWAPMKKLMQRVQSLRESQLQHKDIGPDYNPSAQGIGFSTSNEHSGQSSALNEQIVANYPISIDEMEFSATGLPTTVQTENSDNSLAFWDEFVGDMKGFGFRADGFWDWTS